MPDCLFRMRHPAGEDFSTHRHRRPQAMATVLRQFQFRQRSKYPWGQWSNGQIWRVKQREDFDVDAASFKSVLSQRAALKGMRVRVNTLRDGVIVFQFYSP
jgi:hypothetical protein